MNLDLQGEQIRPLFINLDTDVSRNIFIELVLNELIDGLVDAHIYLVLDLREVGDQIAGLSTKYHSLCLEMCWSTSFLRDSSSNSARQLQYLIVYIILYLLLISSCSEDWAELRVSRSLRILGGNKYSALNKQVRRAEAITVSVIGRHHRSQLLAMSQR